MILSPFLFGSRMSSSLIILQVFDGFQKERTNDRLVLLNNEGETIDAISEKQSPGIFIPLILFIINSHVKRYFSLFSVHKDNFKKKESFYLRFLF